MALRRVSLVLPQEIVFLLDQEKGDQSRAKFVHGAILDAVHRRELEERGYRWRFESKNPRRWTKADQRRWDAEIREQERRMHEPFGDVDEDWCNRLGKALIEAAA